MDESEDAAQKASEARTRGAIALRERRYEEALAVFRQAYQATCSNTVLFTIGVALERLDRFDAAEDVIDEYAHREPSEIGQRRAASYRACITRRRRDRSIDCLAEEIAQTP